MSALRGRLRHHRESALPKDVTHFDQVDGVYAVSPQCIVPVAALLRKALLELSIARQSSEGRETKAAMVYQYLTGPRFRQRTQAIVEAFTSMSDELNIEKKVIQRPSSACRLGCVPSVPPVRPSCAALPPRLARVACAGDRRR